MFGYIITAIIVILAVLYLGRVIYKSVKGKGCGCSCSSCPSNKKCK